MLDAVFSNSDAINQHVHSFAFNLPTNVAISNIELVDRPAQNSLCDSVTTLLPLAV